MDMPEFQTRSGVACAIRPVGRRCGRYELGRRLVATAIGRPGLGVLLTASARGRANSAAPPPGD